MELTRTRCNLLKDRLQAVNVTSFSGRQAKVATIDPGFMFLKLVSDMILQGGMGSDILTLK